MCDAVTTGIPYSDVAGMVTTPSGVTHYKRRKYLVIGGLSSGIVYKVHESNLANSGRALVERVYLVNGAPPPQPVPGAFSRLRGFGKAVSKRVGIVRRVDSTTFVEESPAHKKTIYENARLDLLQRSVTRKDAHLNSFVKCEKINFTDKEDPAPRIIQPRNPRYNLEVGRWLRRMEHKVYAAIGEIYGRPTVMKGYNCYQVASHIKDGWDTFSDPVAVGLDASRFDQHVSKEALEWEHSVYLDCVSKQDRPKLQKLLLWQIYNQGRVLAKDGRIDYSVVGRRMSGDMNTALGNCLLMCALVHCFMDGRKHALYNNGDDCVVIMERAQLRHMAKLKEWFLGMGFTMKVEEPVYQLEHIEFCQTKPVWDGVRWRMVRNLRTCMAKDAVIPKHIVGDKSILKHIATLGQCGAALSTGLPVLQEYYQAMLRVDATPGKRESSGMAFMARGLQPRVGPVTDEARASFYWAFGILPDLQVEMEESLRAWTMDTRSDDVTPNIIASFYEE